MCIGLKTFIKDKYNYIHWSCICKFIFKSALIVKYALLSAHWENLLCTELNWTGMHNQIYRTWWCAIQWSIGHLANVHEPMKSCTLTLSLYIVCLTLNLKELAFWACVSLSALFGVSWYKIWNNPPESCSSNLIFGRSQHNRTACCPSRAFWFESWRIR